MSSWIESAEQVRKCNNCGTYGDEDYDGTWVDTNEWWCAECIKLKAREAAEQVGAI